MKLKNNITGSWFIIIAISSLFLGLIFGILGGFQHLFPDLLKENLSFQKTRPLHAYLSINWIFTAATGISTIIFLKFLEEKSTHNFWQKFRFFYKF